MAGACGAHMCGGRGYRVDPLEAPSLLQGASMAPGRPGPDGPGGKGSDDVPSLAQACCVQSNALKHSFGPGTPLRTLASRGLKP
jgi:hypothetical protein